MSTTIETPDLETGDLRPVGQISNMVDGRRPNPTTVWRWVVRGLRGGTVKLQATMPSGRWYCTEDDYRQFLIAQTEAAMQAHGNDDIDASDQALSKAGLL